MAPFVRWINNELAEINNELAELNHQDALDSEFKQELAHEPESEQKAMELVESNVENASLPSSPMPVAMLIPMPMPMPMPPQLRSMQLQWHDNDTSNDFSLNLTLLPLELTS